MSLTPTFQDFGFDDRILKGIEDAGFKAPMPVQSDCFRLLLQEKRDIYAQSQTGTGKTAAFLLGIFQLMLTDENYKGQKALIVVPTRELAVQIEREATVLSKHIGLNAGSVYGGVGYGAQEKMLEKGVDILIGTPGRLIDFHKQRKIRFSDFSFIVIDEADRLFDMGFLPDLRKILKNLKPYNERHTMLFSATLNPRVGNLAWEYMNDPGEVIIEPEKVTVDTVTQELYHVGKNEKINLLLGVLKRDEPSNAVIFTNTRHSAWEVAKRLEVNGYSVVFLMGDLPQSKRLKIVDEVKKGHHKFLVATDVAARGLHIDDLEMVINYDVPLEAESYVHRIGRTARAGREGKTVTLACEEYVYGLPAIERILGHKLPVSWADDGLMVEDKSAQMRFPHQERYRDMGIERPGGRNDRSRDNRSRSGASGSGERRPKAKRPVSDVRTGRSSEQSKNIQEEIAPAMDNNNKNPNTRPHTPKPGKKPLDPRAARIQSVVSSVAGSGTMDEAPETRSARKENRRADVRPNRSKSDKVNKKVSAPAGKNKSGPREKTSGRNDNRTKPGVERVSSSSSVDERLAYYREKYGEDFEFKSGTSGKKNKAGRRSRKPAASAGTKEPASAAQDQSGVSDKTERGGFLKKLFGKK